MNWTRSAFLQSIALSGPAMALALKNGNNENLQIDELVEIWHFSEEMALDFAEIMPEKYYEHRPVDYDGLYSYGGQMLHIGHNITGLISNYVTDDDPPELPESAEELSKEEVITAMKSAFDFGEEAIQNQTRDSLFEEVPFFAEPLPRWHVLFIAQDHTTHHLGQAVIYLRSKGIVPPRYRKWES